MTTQEYLDQLYNIDQRIKDKISESEKWREIAESTGTKMSDIKVLTTPKPQKMADAVVLAVDYEQESNALAKMLVEKKRKIIHQIDGIENELYYNILKSYYVKEMKFVEIAAAEGYSSRQLRRFKEEALYEFEQKYGMEYLGNSKKLKNLSQNVR